MAILMGIAASLNRESFVFVPAPTLYDIPAVIPFVGVSGGLELSL